MSGIHICCTLHSSTFIGCDNGLCTVQLTMHHTKENHRNHYKILSLLIQKKKFMPCNYCDDKFITYELLISASRQKDQNDIHNLLKRRLNLGNAYYHSLQNTLLFSYLRSFSPAVHKLWDGHVITIPFKHLENCTTYRKSILAQNLWNFRFLQWQVWRCFFWYVAPCSL